MKDARQHLHSKFTLQAFDSEGNSAPFIVTIETVLVNDKVLNLLLDGTGGNMNYTTEFAEGQNYPGFSGTIPVQLSDGLLILDDDVGPKVLTSVEVSIIGGMYNARQDGLCVCGNT